jgi:hypothetical protein
MRVLLFLFILVRRCWLCKLNYLFVQQYWEAAESVCPNPSRTGYIVLGNIFLRLIYLYFIFLLGCESQASVSIYRDDSHVQTLSIGQLTDEQFYVGSVWGNPDCTSTDGSAYELALFGDQHEGVILHSLQCEIDSYSTVVTFNVDSVSPDSEQCLGTDAQRYIKCATGYSGISSYDPSNKITCSSSNAWSGFTGCTINDCGIPSRTGYVVGSGGTTYQSIRSVTCATGYSGTAASITCQADSTWTDFSGCTINSCSLPFEETIPMGYELLSFDSNRAHTYGSTWPLQCIVGWTGTEGSLSQALSDIVCQADYTWSPYQGCTINDCGTPPSISGYVYERDITTYAVVLATYCAPGYGGTATDLTCQADATWTTPRGCQVNDCGVPGQTSYTFSSGSTSFGSTRSAACASGWVGEATSISCQSDLTWSQSTGCLFVGSFCGSPSQPGYDFGSGIPDSNNQLNPACDDGYTGTATSVSCQSNGAWSISTGCSPVSCGSPSARTGYVYASGDSTYRSIRPVTCAVGYVGSPSSIRCEYTGFWTSTSGCTIVDCNTPSFPGYTVSTGTTTYQSSRSMACASGWTGTPSSTIVCQSEGSWTFPIGCSFSAGGCSAPVQTGYNFGDGSPNMNSEVSATCAIGYSGTASAITCSNGIWSLSSGCSGIFPCSSYSFLICLLIISNSL